MQFLPTSRHVCNIVSYVLFAAIWVMPVVQSVAPPDVSINAVQAVRMSAHMAFTVLSAATPNIDNARASNSAIESAVSSKHWVVNVVQDWRISSSFFSWASLICANASSINSSHT